ncbi:hypothetical protein DACRYDRAFT_116582 [Dacryopinax primogenitus]|uniref:Protein kinase domain-containing protein n=1 Tax=Dacryopinax primogenitus (strain DJM 731) TaxID=1858805 RepID=M5FZU4_DACPD|nr:uncharacterized protein DACRYDRAFT_116582 [Dacryopinax primogenitus]EJU01415.1 hypothetical protein DACRYDRAFT_116582 [Dacryopinax primogenitus]
MTLRLSPRQLVECSAVHPRWQNIRDMICNLHLPSSQDGREAELPPIPIPREEPISHPISISQVITSFPPYPTLCLPKLSDESLRTLAIVEVFNSGENFTARASLNGQEVFVKGFSLPENEENYENEKAAYTAFLSAYTTWPKYIPRYYGSCDVVAVASPDRSIQEYAIMVLEFIDGADLTTESITETLAVQTLGALHVAHTALVLPLDIELRHFIVRTDNDQLMKKGTVDSTRAGTSEFKYDELPDVDKVVLVDFDRSSTHDGP